MRLNKMRNDDYYEQLYSNKRIKNIISKILNVLYSILSFRKNSIQIYFLKIFWTLFPKKINNYELEYDFSDDKELKKEEKHFDPMLKVVVYTSVFGNYDTINEPLYVNKESIQYIAITDQDIPSGSAWTKYDTSLIEGFDKLDAYHKSKYCKLHPHRLFPTYDYSIWVDGNVQIVADLFPLILRMENHFMGTFRNPCHDDIYTEARFCIYHNAVNMKAVNMQMDKYRSEGFPDHFGMREFSIIVRKHNDAQCIDLMTQWWNEVNTYTMRDQLSFPYLLWKNNLTIDTVKLLGENWRMNPRFMVKAHRQAHNYVSK